MGRAQMDSDSLTSLSQYACAAASPRGACPFAFSGQEIPSEVKGDGPTRVQTWVTRG